MAVTLNLEILLVLKKYLLLALYSTEHWTDHTTVIILILLLMITPINHTTRDGQEESLHYLIQLEVSKSIVIKLETKFAKINLVNMLNSLNLLMVII